MRDSCRLKRHVVPGVTLGADRLRERLQMRSGDPAVAGIKRDDRGVDEREQLSARRSACYIATRARFSSILQRARPLPRVPANPDSSTGSTLLLAPALSCDVAGPTFDSRRLHFS